MVRMMLRKQQPLAFVSTIAALVGVFLFLAVVPPTPHEPISLSSVADAQFPVPTRIARAHTWEDNPHSQSFVELRGIDVNVGLMYDLKQLSRQRWCRNGSNSLHAGDGWTGSAGAGLTCHPNNTVLEPIGNFTLRCAEACLTIGGDGEDCTAFVVLYEGECVLKRFLLSHRMERPDAVSYVRRIEDANSSVFQRNFPRVDVDKIRRRLAFAVITSVVHLHTRLIPALQTWLCDVDALMLLEDDAASRAAVGILMGATGGGDASAASSSVTPSFWNKGTTAAIPTSNITIDAKCMVGKYFAFEPPPDDIKARSYNGAWKNFPLVHHVYRQFPLKSWYLMVDDDSFIVQHNLNVLITSVFERVVSPQTRGMMFGAIFRVGGTKELFVQGGAGILITRAAVQLLSRAVAPRDLAPPQQNTGTDSPEARAGINTSRIQRRDGLPQCHEWCQQWAGDVRLGCCARMLGIAMKHDFTFWSEDGPTSIASRRRISYFPTSMHQMKVPAIVKDMHAAVTWGESLNRCCDGIVCREVLHAIAPLAKPTHTGLYLSCNATTDVRRLPTYWEPVVGYLEKGLKVPWLNNE